MPSYIEYWQTLSYSTCQQYKTYKNIVRFRKNLFKHATKNGVTLINSPGDNDYQNFISNIIKPGARRAAEDNGIAFRAKRVRLPKIEIAQAPVVVDNAMEQQADAAIVPTVIIHEIEQQPMMQEADVAPIAQEQCAEQPMEQKQWAEQTMVDAALVQAQAPIANGARRVVPTNTLVLNGLVIEVDLDTFMVNATQMCRAAGKLFGNYWQLDSTKNYLRELSFDIGIPISKLYEKTKGGQQDLQGTRIHFRLALHLAHWLSTEVQVQFSKWIAELLLAGRVELGNEMDAQQLEDVWRRINQKVQAKASADLSAEQDRSRDLELQLATIQEAQKLTKAAQDELKAIKVREDLETTIQALVKNIAPIISSYKYGDNALYLARIDGTKFKYGHTKNLVQRFDAHMRPGVYPTFEPVGIFSCNNGVAAEDKVHAYVKKKKIGVDYGTQREIILLDNVDKMQRLIKMMQKRQPATKPANDNTDVVLRRIDAETSIELKRIELLMECKITFEQYLQMK